jgi:hypothetical protein
MPAQFRSDSVSPSNALLLFLVLLIVLLILPCLLLSFLIIRRYRRMTIRDYGSSFGSPVALSREDLIEGDDDYEGVDGFEGVEARWLDGVSQIPITLPPLIDEEAEDQNDSGFDDASAPLLRRALEDSARASRSPSPATSARSPDAGARNPFTNHRLLSLISTTRCQLQSRN